MLSFRETSVTDETALALLSEYFGYRAESFPGPGPYRPTMPVAADFTVPRGVFLIAQQDATPAGCGGVRAIGPEAFELKHLWVRPESRGAGVGRALLAELEARALALGAREVLLDTNDSLEAARSLYGSSRYVEIEPYNQNPNATRWFRKQLG